MQLNKLAFSAIYILVFLRSVSYALYGIRHEKNAVFAVTVLILAASLGLFIKYLQSTM